MAEGQPSTPLEVAVAYFEALADQNARFKPGSSQYYVREGAGRAISFLRAAEEQGKTDPLLLRQFRAAEKAADLAEGEAQA